MSHMINVLTSESIIISESISIDSWKADSMQRVFAHRQIVYLTSRINFTFLNLQL